MPSRSSACAKTGSSATCRCTRSSKLRLSAILPSVPSRPPPALLVVSPHPDRSCDILCSALFCAAGQQDHRRLAVPAEITPVPGPEIDPVFEHAFPHSFHVRQVALPEKR